MGIESPRAKPARTVGAGLLMLVLAGCAPSGADAPAEQTARPRATAEPTPTLGAAEAILAQCEGAPAGETVALTISANSSGFDTDRLEGPRHCEPFTVTLANADEVAPHNFAVFPADQVGLQLFGGDAFKGPRSVTYEIPALPAGEYLFVCSLHRESMRGTLVVSSS